LAALSCLSQLITQTISREKVEELLMGVCPSFGASRERLEYHQDYDDQPEPLFYFLAAGFVRHLTTLNAEGRKDAFAKVFNLLEEMLLRGDEYVVELTVIGFLEGLQNTNLHPIGSRPEDFLVYLGPVSKWWWEEVDLFWAGNFGPIIGTSGRPHPVEMGNSGRRLPT
jgi:hypothetical protein